MCLFDSNYSVLLYSENKYDDDDDVARGNFPIPRPPLDEPVKCRLQDIFSEKVALY